MDNLFVISNLRCSYDRHFREGVSKVVLQIEQLHIPKGRIVFIVGESGIGKSTILEVLGMMNNTIVPDSDAVFDFYDNDGNRLSLLDMWHRNNDRELSSFRRRNFNFIFQSTNLMRNFTAYENISITRMLQGYSQESSFENASVVLRDLGLEHIGQERMVQELSGGQQQRLAFARAILPDFSVLFGDEPTGNLDSENAVRAMELLMKKLSEFDGRSAIIVSHDMHLAVTFADVIVKIRKEANAHRDSDDEYTYHGHIDDKCVYLPDDGKNNWSNGDETFSSADFENYLRSRQ